MASKFAQIFLSQVVTIALIVETTNVSSENLAAFVKAQTLKIYFIWL